MFRYRGPFILSMSSPTKFARTCSFSNGSTWQTQSLIQTCQIRRCLFSSTEDFITSLARGAFSFTFQPVRCLTTISNAHFSAKKQIIYTCKVCNSRESKTFSKTSYEKGIVIVRCTSCDSLHLIADNLGWFKHAGGRNIEEILKQKGESVTIVSCKDNTQNDSDKNDDGLYHIETTLTKA